MGYSDGYNQLGRRTIDWDNVEESQAGTGRHKDAGEAYLMGFSDGSQDLRLGNSSKL